MREGEFFLVGEREVKEEEEEEDEVGVFAFVRRAGDLSKCFGPTLTQTLCLCAPRLAFCIGNLEGKILLDACVCLGGSMVLITPAAQPHGQEG